MSVRTTIVEALTAALPPKKFDVRDEEALPDVLSTSAVTVRLVEYEPAANYQGSMTAKMRVTLVSRYADPGKADQDLDDTLPDVLKALGDTGAVWQRATRVLVQNRYIAQAVDCTFITNTIT